MKYMSIISLIKCIFFLIPCQEYKVYTRVYSIGGWQPKKNKPYPTFLILGLGFFGLLLGKFWHNFNESRLLFL